MPYMSKDESILDFGSGLGNGTKCLRANGYSVDSYEPNFKKGFAPDYNDCIQIKDKYDTVICSYVLNVLSYGQRCEVLLQIKERLKKNGRVFFIVRSWSNVKKTKGRKHEPSMSLESSIGTFQQGYTRETLEDELRGSGFREFHNIKVGDLCLCAIK